MAIVARLRRRLHDGRRLLRFLTGLTIIALAFGAMARPAVAAAPVAGAGSVAQAEAPTAETRDVERVAVATAGAGSVEPAEAPTAEVPTAEAVDVGRTEARTFEIAAAGSADTGVPQRADGMSPAAGSFLAGGAVHRHTVRVAGLDPATRGPRAPPAR